MPNHKLSPRVISLMTNNAKDLTERRVKVAQIGFPLSREKFQAAILPAKWRQVIMEMDAEHLSLNRSTSVSVMIERDNIPRAAGVVVSTGDYSNQLVNCSLGHTHIDYDVLTPDEIAALTKWTNNVVTERRLANLAFKTTDEFLSKYAESVGHVIARWPALTMLVRERKGQYPAVDHNAWRLKFADPPRTLKPYQWSAQDLAHGWPAKHRKAMRLAETMLTSALMLNDPADPPSGVLRASLQRWTPAPGDRDKP